MSRALPYPRPLWRKPVVGAVPRRTFLSSAALAVGGMAIARAEPLRCVLTPDSGEGPFYFDPSLVRTDVRDSRPGAPLALDIRVVRAGDCATLEQARVDIWHADALGLYSGYERQPGVGGISTAGVIGESFLRGTQFTGAEGLVSFRTIYPSWYGGRTPHVHCKVFVGDDEVIATQIFFSDDVNDHVFGVFDPYRQHVAKRATRNADDRFLTDEIGGAYCEAVVTDAGIAASVVIAVQKA